MTESIDILPFQFNCADQAYQLRYLTHRDGAALGRYFVSLSEQTRGRFGPHPLTREFADVLAARCHGAGGQIEDTALRLLVEGDRGEVVAYFILELTAFPHEIERYRRQDIALSVGMDISFAPSVADALQNIGLASAVMPIIIQLVRRRQARSLVLMGGTQESNQRAIAFYEKFGFCRCGGYQTDVFNYDMRLLLTDQRI